MIISLAALLLSSCVRSPSNDNSGSGGSGGGKNPTAGIEYAVSSDGTCAIVIGYEGSAQNVVIANEYNGVPVARIGNNAFANNKSLRSVTLPDSLLVIGDGAFSGCEWLDYITLPDTVKEIGEGAFKNCKLIEGFYVPSALETVGESAFEGCINLEWLSVKSIDGWLNIDFANATANPLYYGDELYLVDLPVASIEIGNGVSAIHDYALSFSSLKYLTVTGADIDLQRGVLADCKNLVELSIPTLGKSGEGKGFLGYLFGAESNAQNSAFIPTSLKTVTLTGASSVEEGAFLGASSLVGVNLSSATKSIGKDAFYGCSGLKSITVPNSVSSVGQGAFANCTSLISVTIGSGIREISEGMFSGCTSLSSVTLSEGVSAIGKNSFKDCTRLVTVSLPVSLSSIGEGAFAGCSAITVLTVPEKVSAIGFGAFEGCNSIGRITLPIVGGGTAGADHLGYIFGAESYEQNSSFVPSNLKNITITNSQVVGDGAFYGLGSITKLTLPNNLVTIGSNAFFGCTALTTISIPDGTLTVGNGAFKGCTGLTTVALADSITAIGDDAFMGCLGITRINIPASLTHIGKNSFKACAKISSIELPDSLTYIGEGAFAGCLGIYWIDIPSAVSYIGFGAFEGCSNIMELSSSIIGIDADTSYLGYMFGASSYLENATFVPAGLQTVSFTNADHIGEGAFYDLSTIVSLSVNGDAASIGSLAFYGCSSVASLSIPDSVTSIGKNAFNGCVMLNSLDLPKGLITIGEGAFAGCSSLTELEIPKSTTSIGFGALEDCTSIAILSLPFAGGTDTENTFLGYIFGAESASAQATFVPTTLTTVTTTSSAPVGIGAFKDVASITSLTISKSCASIGLGAFEGMTSLTTLSVPFAGGSETSNTFIGYGFGAASYSENASKLPASLVAIELSAAKKIDTRAFSGCSTLRTVILPMGLLEIGGYAFENCTNLGGIVIPITVTKVSAGAFSGTSGRISAMADKKPSGWSSSWKPSSVRVSWSSEYHGKTDDGWLYSQTLSAVTVTGYEGDDTHISIPSSINGCPVVAIGQDAFYSKVNIESVNIPETILEIGKTAFSGCTNLAEITLPKNLETLHEGAFYGCGFRELFIPKSVVTIGISAFSYCSNLTKVTFESGSNLKTVESCAFKMSSNISEIYISDLAFWCSLTFVDDYANPLTYAKSFFINGEHSSTITIPEGVTSIGQFAFTGAIPKIISIPDSVSYVSDSAFCGCTALTGIYLSENVSYVGANAFNLCARVTVYCAAASAPEGWNESWNYSNRPVIWGCLDSGITYGDIQWVQTADGNITLIGYAGESTALILPDSVNSVPVTAIGSSLFRDNKAIESITVPESITRIGAYAFSGCNALTTVVFENADGWMRSSNQSATSGTEIPSADLSIPSVAAKFLVTDHSKQHWFK